MEEIKRISREKIVQLIDVQENFIEQTLNKKESLKSEVGLLKDIIIKSLRFIWRKGELSSSFLNSINLTQDQATNLLPIEYFFVDDSSKVSIRAVNCLRTAEIDTISKLMTYTEKDLLKFRNFGRKCLDKVNEVLSGKGLSIEKR